VNTDTVRNWETGRTEVEFRYYSLLFPFLGYNPLPEARTHAEAIRRARLSRGWSQGRLAELAGVDETTARRLEADTRGTARRSAQAVYRVLGIDAEER